MAASILIVDCAVRRYIACISRAVPERTARALHASGDCENPVAAAAGFQEPSLVFLAGTSTRCWTAPAPPNSCVRAAAASHSSKRGTSGASCAAPTRSDCATRQGPRDRRIQLSHRPGGVDRGLPLGGRVDERGWRIDGCAGGFHRHAAARSLCSSGRRPALGPRPAWPPRGRLAIGALAAIAVLLSRLVVLDARSVAGARALPARAGLAVPAHHRTWAVGLVSLADRHSAAGAAAARFHSAAAVLAQCSCGYLGPARLCLHRDRSAGPVRDHRQAADRPGAAVRRRRRRLGLAAVGLARPSTRAFPPATRPRPLRRPLPSARSGRRRAR